MNLTHILRHLLGGGPHEPESIATQGTPREDDWERQRRQEREEELIAEYEARAKRVEDEFTVQLRDFGGG